MGTEELKDRRPKLLMDHRTLRVRPPGGVLSPTFSILWSFICFFGLAHLNFRVCDLNGTCIVPPNAEVRLLSVSSSPVPPGVDFTGEAEECDPPRSTSSGPPSRKEEPPPHSLPVQGMGWRCQSVSQCCAGFCCPRSC